MTRARRAPANGGTPRRKGSRTAAEDAVLTAAYFNFTHESFGKDEAEVSGKSGSGGPTYDDGRDDRAGLADAAADAGIIEC